MVPETSLPTVTCVHRVDRSRLVDRRGDVGKADRARDVADAVAARQQRPEDDEGPDARRQPLRR